MVTRDDHWELPLWLKYHVHEFDRLAILDGSDSKTSRALVQSAASKYSNVIYSHESDFNHSSEALIKKTDNGLRSLAWSLLNETELLGKKLMQII